MTTVGQALVRALQARGVDTVFGIPGVHTIELYRGLAGSGIRHVTARHEQGAAFMADGYARATGRPGVAFVITGPGLTNALTAMAQARADSVPMLVISGVNRRDSLGRGLGHLHELPDQRALAATVALSSERVEAPEELHPVLGRAFERMTRGGPGPVHVEIPIEVAGMDWPGPAGPHLPSGAGAADEDAVARAASVLSRARAPVILAGGGARRAGDALRDLAERLDAPVVLTANARGLMHGHRLAVAASPSLAAVRALIEGADAVLATGTELGPTDYDIYATGTSPALRHLVRIDTCPEQLARRESEVAILADAGAALRALSDVLGGDVARAADGAARADRARREAWAGIGPAMRAMCGIVDAIREARPGAILVGDSTQPVYAGNLFHDHDRPGGWFNAATGFGALGYAIPAAIGAATGAPGAPVVCLAGDGGAQFSLAELMCAAQERLPITFLIWNNRGYREIAETMRGSGIEPVGCDPVPPDFGAVAAACGMPHERVAAAPGALVDVLGRMVPDAGPVMIEIDATNPVDSDP